MPMADPAAGRKPSAPPASRPAAPKRGEQRPGAELGALGDGAGDQRGGDDREGELEGGEHQVGDSRDPGRAVHEAVLADVLQAAENPSPLPNASESPYSTQASVTVTRATHDIIIMFSTLLARASRRRRRPGRGSSAGQGRWRQHPRGRPVSIFTRDLSLLAVQRITSVDFFRKTKAFVQVKRRFRQVSIVFRKEALSVPGND